MDLEARLRRLKLADPAPGLAREVRAAVRDARLLRIAWRAAAMAAGLALAVGLLPSATARPAPPQPTAPLPEMAEFGLPYPLLAARLPSEPLIPTLERRLRQMETEGAMP